MRKALLYLTAVCCIVMSTSSSFTKAVTLPVATTERTRVATPSQDESRNYKYIPLGYGNQNDDFSQPASVDFEDHEPKPHTILNYAPSEVVLTLLRTVLDVVRKVNRERVDNPGSPTSKKHVEAKPEDDKAVPNHLQNVIDATEQSVAKDDNKNPEITTEVNESEEMEDVTDGAKGRGFEDYYDDHHHDHETTTTTTAAPAKQSRFSDPWTGYYDFLINEGSYKFWSAFQLFTAALLLYSCLAAIYYAKFNPIIQDYDTEYDDYFIGRSDRKTRSLANPKYLTPSGQRGLRSSTFRRILDAVSKEVL